MVGVDVFVLVKYNSLVFSGVVSFFGNLFFFKGNFGKVLVEVVFKFSDNGVINYFYVVGGGVEGIVVICILFLIFVNCFSVLL